MRGLLVSFFCLFSYFVFGQASVVTKQYTINNGLIANDVRSICLDSNGILWLGSRSGLSKIIQGQVVTDEDATKLRFTNITDILEDKDKGIWIGSYGQGILYKGKNKTVTLTTKDGLISDRIRRISIFNDFVYVGTVDGISIISLDTFKITNLRIEKQNLYQLEVSDFFSYQGKVYATTINAGVYLVEKDHLIKENDIKRIFSVYQKDDYVFYGCQTGLIVYNLKTKKIEYEQAIPSIRYFKEINSELFIVSAGLYENKGGLFKWNGNEVENITSRFGINTTELYSLSYDKTNDFLYIGSGYEGLYQIDLFSALSYDASLKNITALENLDKRIFVFSQEGLTIKRENELIKNVPLTTFKDYQEKMYKRYVSFMNHDNHFFELDYTIPADKILFYKAVREKNTIWVSTNIGLFQINKYGKLIDYYNIHTYQFGFDKGHLIETNPYGGVRYYHDLKALKYSYYFRIDSDHIPRDIVDIKKVNNTLFFAGALDGLYSYNEKQGFLSYNTDGLLQERRIKKLANGKNNTLYLATDFNSIYRVKLGQEPIAIEEFLTSEDILGSTINLLTCVDDKLILGTNRGLTVITPEGKFYFDSEQGFLHKNITSYIKDGNLLYIGTNSGLYILDVNYFQKKQQNLKVSLSKILVNGIEVPSDIKQLSHSRILNLSSNENSLQISFNVFGAKFPNKLDFKYRLKPTESWNDVKGLRLDLHYLESGLYPIDLQIIDYDTGNKLVYPLLYLAIDKPFYLSIWFFVGCGMLILIISFLYYRFRIMKYKREKDINEKKLLYQKRLAEVKLLAVRSQMNSHFIFNVLSSIQYFIVTDLKDEAFTYLGKFANLIRRTLNVSTKERITLKEEIDYLKDYVEIENMRLDGRVTFEVEIKDAINLNAVEVPPMLLQPFIENSLVHAFPKSIEHPRITITVFKQAENLVIVMKDNGIGSLSKENKKHKYESKGMSIVRERMSLIQEYLEEDLIMEVGEKGTTVTLLLKKVI